MGEMQRLFEATDYMRRIDLEILKENPAIISMLRMSTAPPIARDRLIGLANVKASLVKTMELDKLPGQMPEQELNDSLLRIIKVITEMLDQSLFGWLYSQHTPGPEELEIAQVVVSDRRCGVLSDPIIRNTQEARQLNAIRVYLESKGYRKQHHLGELPPHEMESGTFAFHQNVPIINEAGRRIKMPIDIVIQPKSAAPRSMPLLIEAKSAGDFTNTNKRRKEEATKIRQLRATYGDRVDLILLLCGYFDAGFLGYEAAEGLDWVWEHRIEDLDIAGI